MEMKFEDLKKAYIEELSVPGYLADLSGLGIPNKTPAEVAEKMLNEIANCKHPSDWLKYNPALKRACKRQGIKKSSELRQVVKTQLVPQSFDPEFQDHVKDILVSGGEIK